MFENSLLNLGDLRKAPEQGAFVRVIPVVLGKVVVKVDKAHSEGLVYYWAGCY